VHKIVRKLGLLPTAIGEIYADDGQDGVDIAVGRRQAGQLNPPPQQRSLAVLVCGFDHPPDARLIAAEGCWLTFQLQRWPTKPPGKFTSEGF